ncbi:MAG: efflux RND transporter periplasmic adaptor subunit [Candidatus Aminicenantes bacterium]|nr:efflux RND transporter periplasmic adaptor subunit [Candidatus Aminicenantes bacterium]
MKKKIIIGTATLFLVIALTVILLQKGSKADVASAQVDYGEFVVKMIESGEVSAIQSVSVFAPRVRGRLQINKLIKDGSRVQQGDVVVQFDMVETQQEMLKSLSDLNIAQSEIEKKLSNIESQKRIDQMELDSTKLQYDEAKLDLRKGILLSQVEQEKLKLRYEQAEKRLQETLKKMESQTKFNQADLNVLSEKKAKAEADYTMAKKSLADMTLMAPKEGLVVLKEIWKGTGMSKVQEGDQVWPGYPILEIPDLSAMEIKMYLNEVDVSKVAPGQEALITIDAFPDMVFGGKVERIASMATKKDWDAKIKTFETVVSLNEMDSRMRPGMTCLTEIIIKKIPEVIFVPIEAVFEKEGKTVVYVMGSRSARKREVALGDRNSTHIVITQGLSQGDRIALRDPFAGPEAKEASSPKKS